LRFDGVLAGPIERFDKQMLLDPLEEQLDLPSGLVELANGQRRERQVVGQQDQVFLTDRVAINDPPQLFRVELRGQGAGQSDG